MRVFIELIPLSFFDRSLQILIDMPVGADFRISASGCFMKELTTKDGLQECASQQAERLLGHPCQNIYQVEIRDEVIDHTNVLVVSYLTLFSMGSDSASVFKQLRKWEPLQKRLDLLPGHEKKELEKAKKYLRNKSFTSGICFEVLPLRFTLTQMQNLFEELWERKFDKRNFRKKIARTKYVIPLTEKEYHVSHKPARYYMFSDELFSFTYKPVMAFP
ncbi:NrtR DNA-binding winged helix domain-containing protein [Marinilabilia rubra]|uniref:NrtR DNA-binding winged helix domain-containing protein n=1 Tax=Marinilabilia rubra TaxID=2162893 RepID=A0A2U2B443_9BACT|nr:hypothetical protein [Marinilabilia rubra]PWD97814.1 hypothetical protein DDZ16_18665 [Marinilabilia rubra]